MSSLFTLSSDKQFIEASKNGRFNIDIYVYVYEGDLQNFSDDKIHSWKFANAICGSGETLEVHGVKFTPRTHEFASLRSDLILAGEGDGARTLRFRVNRAGVCFVNVSKKEWVRVNCLFSWSKHGVEVPVPRGGEIWSVLGSVNGAVSDELLSLRERSKKLMKESDKLKDETESFFKRSLEEKEKEAASLKTVWEEKEDEVTSLKDALKALMDK